MVKVTGNIRIKYRFTVLLLVTTTAAVVFGLYQLYGIATTVSKSRIRIAEMKRDIILIDKTIADKTRLNEDALKVRSTIPSQYYEVAYFTSQIERLAKNNNLTIVMNIDQKKKEEKAPYSSIVFSLEIAGGYNSVAEFFSQLSKLPYQGS